MGRRDRLAEALGSVLPADFPLAVSIVRDLLPSPRDKAGYGPWSGAWILVCSRFVSLFGLSHPELSLGCLSQITRRFTAEFDVRPFFREHPTLTLQTAHVWTQHPCEHVRRLASESLRPRLPWAPRLRELEANPQPLLQLVDRLVDDPSQYVRKSVANVFADIYKADPGAALLGIESYLREPTVSRVWIARHALRYAVAQGNRPAMRLLAASLRRISANLRPPAT